MPRCGYLRVLGLANRGSRDNRLPPTPYHILNCLMVNHWCGMRHMARPLCPSRHLFRNRLGCLFVGHIPTYLFTIPLGTTSTYPGCGRVSCSAKTTRLPLRRSPKARCARCASNFTRRSSRAGPGHPHWPKEAVSNDSGGGGGRIAIPATASRYERDGGDKPPAAAVIVPSQKPSQHQSIAKSAPVNSPVNTSQLPSHLPNQHPVNCLVSTQSTAAGLCLLSVGLALISSSFRLFVLMASLRTYPPYIDMTVCRTGEKFTKYAVLGDDVVIADQEVARVQLMLDIPYDALAHYVVLEVPDTGFFLGLTFALHLVLRNEMKPRDLHLTQDEFFVTEKVQDYLEWSLLRLWVRDWLKYCHWESTPRYLYLNPSGRKLGGVSGNSFLVQPFGLNQPSKESAADVNKSLEAAPRAKGMRI
ncbi:hypothetical protein Salat_2581600 [Sesamum alatum]|uniref:Uncharacterized protein n=1 Tax=Sesamum alatum TaxID=300844 RepID=A0AAE1XNP2_9LAMI|nr:hypothetical protein Salat_2581600 [Sesamum alatum]